jgi:tripartite-type tricarboxylate transporter receptor subunit TctC
MAQLISAFSRLVAAVVLTAIVTAGALAQEFPTKPIRFLVGFSAGDGLDLSARIIAEKLSTVLGQPVLVENLPGASSMIAMRDMLNAPADGYTIMLLSPTLTIQSARETDGFDIRRDVAPIIQQSSQARIMYVKTDGRFKDLAGFVAYGKAHPGELNYASLGVGSTPHLLMEYFKLVTGIDMVHIPFKGSAEAVTSVLAGEVDTHFAGLITVAPLVKEGKVLAIAATTAESFQGVPGMKEGGVDNYDFPVWTGIGAKAGTPEPIIRKLNAAINEVYDDPEVVEKFAHLYKLVGGDPETFGAIMNHEVDAWTNVIEKAHITFN